VAGMLQQNLHFSQFSNFHDRETRLTNNSQTPVTGYMLALKKLVLSNILLSFVGLASQQLG
jgi:hypothetical protein